jgi:Fe-S oxidoreductase
VKKLSGFAPERSMPTMYTTTLLTWWKKHRRETTGDRRQMTREKAQVTKKVYLFCDEFTNYNDTEIGIKAVLLLEKLGYEVIIPRHEESGRAWLSKGLVRKAKQIANRNIALLHPVITPETPLIGIEPQPYSPFAMSTWTWQKTKIMRPPKTWQKIPG